MILTESLKLLFLLFWNYKKQYKVINYKIKANLNITVFR